MKVYRNCLVLLVVIMTSACSDWLTVNPKNQKQEDDLFSTGTGYRTALNGIYQQLSEGTVYGREMTWGFMSVIGQNYEWDGLRSTAYKDAGAYEYGTAGCSGIIDAIWSKAYNSIANCNNLIQRVEEVNEDIFDYKYIEKNMIAGEAYALRGMIHFDLLRLFAPAPVQDDHTSHLAYIQTYPTIVGEKKNIQDYLNLVINDLKKGKELLATVDTIEPYLTGIKTPWYRMEPGSYVGCPDMFFSYRGTRMNYYTITALLARVYQYAQEPELALEEAREILNSGYFNFTPVDNISMDNVDSRDQKTHVDLIFSLYNNKMNELCKDYYASGLSGFMEIKELDGLFAGDADDYRKAYLVVSTTTGQRVSIKWRESANTSVFNVQNPLIPMIRLSEIYYIAGECIFDQDREQAIDWLDEARLGRGCKARLPRDLTKEEYIERIIKDARREYLAEGQLFFLYKRLNHPVIDGSHTIELGEKFTLPIPASDVVTF